MTNSPIREADWYDYPRYYDISFRDETGPEADFLEAVCQKYCLFTRGGCWSRHVAAAG